MAKVKITGHASGSGVITVTAPNTSTDRTITLPDATATIATTADVTAATFNPNAAVVFNESGADVDFRVESDGLTHALFVDGGTNRVGIGTGTPDTLLEVQGVANVGGGSDESLQQWNVGSDNAKMEIEYLDGSGNRGFAIGPTTENNFNIKTNDTSRLNITYDGKGRSLFTAAAWFSAEGAGTPSFHQSHNCSSISSMGSDGYYQVNWDTDFANGNYAIVNNAHRDAYEDQSIYNLAYSTQNVRYVYVQDSTGAQDISDFSSLVFGA